MDRDYNGTRKGYNDAGRPYDKKTNPQRENTPRVPTSVRIDVIALANFARYLMYKDGVDNVTKSNLINSAVCVLSDLLVDSNKVNGCESMSEALKQLRQIGLDFESNKRMKKSVRSKLAHESFNLGRLDRTPYKQGRRAQEEKEMEEEFKRQMETKEYLKHANKEQEKETDDEKSLAKKKAGIDDAPVASMIPEDMRAVLREEVERNEGEDG